MANQELVGLGHRERGREREREGEEIGLGGMGQKGIRRKMDEKKEKPEEQGDR